MASSSPSFKLRVLVHQRAYGRMARNHWRFRQLQDLHQAIRSQLRDIDITPSLFSFATASFPRTLKSLRNFRLQMHCIVMHIGACETNARALVVRKESQISYMTATFFLID
jgi:hypothetical protein